MALNFLAGAVAVYLIIGPWGRPGTASTSGTDLIPERAWLPTLGAQRISLVAIIAAVAAVVAVAVLMGGTRYGLRVKAVGRSPASARLMGISPRRYTLSAFVIGGALAGVAGSVQVTGFHHKLVPSISGGYGFLAVLVVLLANFRVVWIAPIALFFAAIQVGSTQLSLRLSIDSSLAGVIEGVLVLSILLVGGWRSRRTLSLAARTAGGRVMETLAGIIAAAAPLIYAAIGETISEKAGVVNLSLDGSILLSAMTGFAAAVASGSVLVGFAAAIAVSVAIAAVVAFSGIELRLNQIAVGFVLFLLARQLALFLGDSYVGQSGPKVPAFDIPLLSEIPFFGTVLFSHNLSVYGAYVVVLVSYVFIYRTRPGLVLRGIGERPEAAFARGVPVNRLRYVYTLVGGALVGVAGAAVSLDQIAGWRENLTTNLGWIALAFVIFGGWHPLRVAGACLIYRGLLYVAGELQGTFPELVQVLTQLPFLLMILMLTAINTPWFRRLGDRHPRWRNLLGSNAPSALGTSSTGSDVRPNCAPSRVAGYRAPSASARRASRSAAPRTRRGPVAR